MPSTTQSKSDKIKSAKALLKQKKAKNRKKTEESNSRQPSGLEAADSDHSSIPNGVSHLDASSQLATKVEAEMLANEVNRGQNGPILNADGNENHVSTPQSTQSQSESFSTPNTSNLPPQDSTIEPGGSLQDSGISENNLNQTTSNCLSSNTHSSETSKMTSQIKTLQEKYTSETQKLAAAQVYLQQFQSQLRLQQQSIKDLLDEKSELQGKVSKLENQIASIKQSNLNSNQSSQGLSLKYDQLQREFQLTSETKLKFQKASEQLENELETLNETYRKVLSRNDELYERNAELSHQVGSKGNELAGIKRDYEILEAEKIKIEKQHKNLQTLHTSSTSEADRERDSKKRSSKDSIHQLKIDQLTTENQQISCQMQELGKSVELYKRTVTGLTQERNKLLSQIEKVNMAWQNRLENKEKEFDRKFKEKLRTRDSDSDDLNKNLKDKTERLEKIVKEKEELSSEVEKLTGEKNKLESRLESQIIDNETLRGLGPIHVYAKNRSLSGENFFLCLKNYRTLLIQTILRSARQTHLLPRKISQLRRPTQGPPNVTVQRGIRQKHFTEGYSTE